MPTKVVNLDPSLRSGRRGVNFGGRALKFSAPKPTTSMKVAITFSGDFRNKLAEAFAEMEYPFLRDGRVLVNDLPPGHED